VYAAPLTVDLVNDRTYTKNVAIQKQHYVVIKDEQVILQAGSDYETVRNSHGGVIGEYDTKQAAVEAAVERMHTAPDFAMSTLARPGDVERQPMSNRAIEVQLKRIREGATVWLDSLPPATVVENDIEAKAHEISGDCVLELPDGTEIDAGMIKDGNVVGATRRFCYRPPADSDGEAVPICARHVTVSNEDNLRDSVAVETYEWLKTKEGETVVQQADDGFTVYEVDELRDGYINPRKDGGLSPRSNTASRKLSYVDGTGEWYDMSDPEINTTLSNTLPGDVDDISYYDSLTDISGIGAATAEKMWCESIGELYDSGWPARAYMSGRFTIPAIAQLYTYGRTLGLSDAVCAVIGQLGGIGINSDGEEIATIASQLTGSVDIDSVETAVIGAKRDGVGPSPSWLSEVDNAELCVGETTREHIRSVIADGATRDPDEVEAYPIRNFYAPPQDDSGEVAIINDDGQVRISEKCIKTAATIANVDLSALEEDDYCCEIYGGRRGGLIHLSNTNHRFSVIINGDQSITAEELFGIESEG
jgi:hypothetical protein